jgi:hypothetical protein
VVALVSIGVLALTGGSEYIEFALVMVFFVSFLVGSYWWIIFGPGRYLYVSQRVLWPRIDKAG